MKRKGSIVLFLSVVLALALVASCSSGEEAATSTPAPTASGPAQTTEYPDEVVIGCLHPLSGPMASAGASIKTAFEIAVDEINAAGGIKNLGGARIKVVNADTENKPDVTTSEAERLVNNENVVALVSTFFTCMSASNVAEKNHVTCFAPYTTTTDLTTRGYHYTFRGYSTVGKEAHEVMDTAMATFANAGVEPKTCALLYCTEACALSSINYIKENIADLGVEIVAEEFYNVGEATSYVPQLIKLEAAEPDFLIEWGWYPDQLIYFKEMMERETYFPYGIWSFGAGLESGNWYAQMPPESYEYIFIHEDCDFKCWERPWYEEKLAKLQEELPGIPWDCFCSYYYSDAWMIKYALERTEYSPDISVFRENFRDAFAAIDITAATCKEMEQIAPDGTKYCPAFVNGWSQVKFDGTTGDNYYSHGQISQIVNGDRHPVWPAEWVEPGFAPVMPIPTWEERG